MTEVAVASEREREGMQERRQPNKLVDRDRDKQERRLCVCVCA